MNEAQLQTSAVSPQAPYSQGGLTFTRRFTAEGVSPYDEVQWERRTASITDTKGNTIFEQKDVEVPLDWSMTATNIVASKYLHGQMDTPERETGVRQLVARVAETVRDWGIAGGYFASAQRRQRSSTTSWPHMLLTQKVAFNSPVWFNVGCDRLEPRVRRPELALGCGHRRREVLRHRLSQSAVLGLLHQRRRRLARLHPHPRQDRGHALQVGIGHGHQSLLHPRLHGTVVGRRHGLAARSASCAVSMPLPASSSRAAKRAAPPRW